MKEPRQWKVEYVTHRETGLIVGMSQDLPGFYVHGRTQQEVRERTPVAIQALLEAAGETVGEIVRCEDEGDVMPNFNAFVAHYALNRCPAEA